MKKVSTSSEQKKSMAAPGLLHKTIGMIISNDGVKVKTDKVILHHIKQI